MMEACAGQLLNPETAEDIELAHWVKPSRLTEVLGNTYASLRELIQNLA